MTWLDEAAAKANAHLDAMPYDQLGPAGKLLRPAPVLATQAWPTNAELIADVAKLGYLDGTVLDATYGEGNFWTVFRPEQLATNDAFKPADTHYSYLDLFAFPKQWFDTVVFDPPYKLSGTPSLGEFDNRYGIAEYMPMQERLADIRMGARECFRVARKYLLVKCQDQVCAGKIRWQTNMVIDAIEGVGGELVDRFDFIYTPRPQPNGRRQVHASRNTSTLLVFQK